MTRRGILKLMGVSTMALGLGGCWPFVRNSRFHARLHIEVMTPQGLKSGTGVLELSNGASIDWGIAGHHGGSVGLRGQAVVVDLSDGPLFALLKQTATADDIGLANAILDALVPPDPKDETMDSRVAANRKAAWASEGSLKADLPRTAWPMLVRFRDINDPKSVEAVDPDVIGVKRIWVENTRDDVTTGIEKRMPPWFMELVHKKARLNGSTSIAVNPYDLTDNLGPDSFSGDELK